MGRSAASYQSVQVIKALCIINKIDKEVLSDYLLFELCDRSLQT